MPAAMISFLQSVASRSSFFKPTIFFLYLSDDMRAIMIDYVRKNEKQPAVWMTGIRTTAKLYHSSYAKDKDFYASQILYEKVRIRVGVAFEKDRNK